MIHFTMNGLNILHKVTRFILIVIPILILGWLTFKKIVPAGKMEATYDMRRETPFISKLYPKDRVSEAIRGVDGDYYRILQAEPVYFDLKPNTQFEKVSVTIKYRAEMPLKIGGLLNKKDWLFDWRDLKSGDEKWQTQTEVFDFSKLAPEGQKFRFGFSTPKFLPGQVEISEIKVIFERKPLTEKEVVNKILDAVVWRVNRLFQHLIVMLS